MIIIIRFVFIIKTHHHEYLENKSVVIETCETRYYGNLENNTIFTRVKEKKQ